MIAGLEGHLAIIEQRLIHERRQAEKPADGRLGARLALPVWQKAVYAALGA